MSNHEGVDRRLVARIASHSEVFVAPWVGEMPTRDNFQSVRCTDTSPIGFAYYSPWKPECDHIVALFGPSQRQFSVIARIVHVTPLQVDGKDVFTIGCRIVERIDNPCKDERELS